MQSSDADPFAAFAAAVLADDAAGVEAILARHPDLTTRLDDPLPGASFGGIAITTATSSRNTRIVDVLLGAGANIEAKTDWWAGGFTALDLADPEFASLLLARGAALTAVAAARLGRIDDLRRMLVADPSRVSERAGDGQTPLHTAATVEIAQMLLDAGADIDALDVDHESTPAMYHVRERPRVTRFLMSRGCRTDILMASAVGDLELVRRHLDRDPSAIRTTVSGKYFPKIDPRAGGTIYIWTLGGNKTPHQIAREFGHGEVYDLLLERTPDALALAIAAELGDEPRVAQLVARNPGLPSTFGDEETIKLVTSAEANNALAVHLMLETGWPSDARQADGATALHYAGFHGNVEMILDLIRHGAPLDPVDTTFSGTPLDWTLYGSRHGWYRRTGDYPGSVRALVRAGAKVPADPAGTPEALAALAR